MARQFVIKAAEIAADNVTAMDDLGISIEGISALKQAQIQAQAGVKVLNGINDQAKAVAAILVDAIKSNPSPKIEGKGQLVDTIA